MRAARIGADINDSVNIMRLERQADFTIAGFMRLWFVEGDNHVLIFAAFLCFIM